MTDDLLAWGVTQIREHHLIDGGMPPARAGDDDRRAGRRPATLWSAPVCWRRPPTGNRPTPPNLFRPCRLNPEERRHVINY